MKKLIFLFYPFLLFAYSHNLFCYYDNVEEKIHCYTPIDTIPACAAYKKYGMFYPVMGGIVWGHGVTHHTDPECVSRNYTYGFVYETVHSSTCLSSSGEPYAYDSIAEFCNADDKKGYTYDKNLNAWFASGKTPICPSGEEWSSTQNKCITLSDCPSGDVLYQGQCYSVTDILKKLLTSDQYNYVQNNCSLVNHSLTTSSGDEICSTSIVCDGEVLKNIQVSCGETNSSNSDNTITCSADQDIEINENTGQVTCVDSNFTIPQDLNNSSDNTSNTNSNNSTSDTSSSINTNSSSSSSSDNNSTSGSSNFSGSDDCCYRYHNPQLGDQWKMVSDGVWKQLNSPYCVVYIKDGKCSVSSDNNSSSVTGSSSGNSLAPVLSELNKTNSTLGSIKDTLNKIVNMKPDKKYDANLSAKTTSMFSGFTDAITNTKKSLNNLKSSFSQVTDLLKNPKKFSLLHSDIETCPIYFTIYNNKLKIDVCSFVSPYKPIIQLFFTLIFSISVVVYFFDVFIRQGGRK